MESKDPCTAAPNPISEVKGRRRAKDRFERRREEIVDVAAKLFAAKGYSATGIRDIGEAADLARGALYYYIHSKESLLGEIHNRVLDPLLDSAHSIVVLEVGASDRLRMISEVLIRQIIDHHDHVWVFLHEYRSLTGERRDTFKTKRAEFEALLLKLFSDGIQSGEFEIDELRLTMLAFLGMHNYTYTWARHGDPLDPLKVSKIYCDAFLGGVTSPATRLAKT